MKTTKQLLNEVATARQSYLTILINFDEQQAQWKPSLNHWNAVEITEHLFWAEQGGILGMWKTLLGIRTGILNYENHKPHEGLTVEEIVQRTWKQKEEVPTIAAPRMGGTLGFWAASLKGLQPILEAFGELLSDEDLSRTAHPHPISGPMNFGQRLAFLRFHIDRHREQLESLIHQF